MYKSYHRRIESLKKIFLLFTDVWTLQFVQNSPPSVPQKNNYVLYSVSGPVNAKSLHECNSVPALFYWRGQLHLYFHLSAAANAKRKISFSVTVSLLNTVRNITRIFLSEEVTNLQHSLFSTKSVSGRRWNDNNNFRVSDFLNICSCCWSPSQR